MKISRTASAVMAVIAVATMSAYASAGTSCCGVPKSKTSVAKKAAPKKVVSAICPVMGTKVADITKAAGKSVYKGKTYYFCCGGCKPAFDKNPAKYVK